MTPTVIIPPEEIGIEYALSGGPGGQNVNKRETKVIVRWQVGASCVLTDEQKDRVRVKLANRINDRDELVIQAKEERSQPQNQALGIERLQTLVANALIIPKPRRKTRPTRASKERRLQAKAARSSMKESRKSTEL